MAGVPGTIEIASDYYIEASFVNQLIQIVGLDVVLKSYFSNLGTNLLEKELCNIINNQDISYQLFRNIETNFQIRYLEGKQNILGNIQLTLLDFLEEKCQQLVEVGNEKEVFNVLGAYEHMMITPEKLRMMQKNPDNYEKVTDSIERFKNIQEKFSYQRLSIEKDTVIK